ncbi:unnamed protein product [Prunus armeniaca]
MSMSRNTAGHVYLRFENTQAAINSRQVLHGTTHTQEEEEKGSQTQTHSAAVSIDDRQSSFVIFC